MKNCRLINFEAYTGQFRRFEYFSMFRSLKNQQFLYAMNGHHFEKAKTRYGLTSQI